MKVIVLSGKMRAGKSYIADHLIENYGYTRISLAAPLKQEVIDLGFTVKDVVEKDPWMRSLLIALGGARREKQPTYWIDRALAKMIQWTEQGRDLFVVDDCRFVNELEAFKDLKALNHEITFARVTRVGGPEPLDDPSETELDEYAGFDAYIDAESGDTDGLIVNALDRLNLKKMAGYKQLDLFKD
jgi:hypothetical protein